MAWQNPKTNWKAGDVPTASDFNRIEDNIQELENTKETPAGAQVKADAAEARAKAYTDQEVAEISQVLDAHSAQLDAKLDKSGGTMTGSLILAGDPTQALEAATKQYVDNNKGGAPQLVELKRFTSSGTFNPADYPSAGNRYFIMILGAGGGSYKSDISEDYFASGGAGAMQFIDFYLPPNSLVTSFPVVIGAASLDSDGGTTSFWCWQAPGGKKATNYTQYGQGGQTGSFTGERGRSDRGGDTMYGRGASSSSSAGRGGGSWRDKVGGGGLCVIYGYVE